MFSSARIRLTIWYLLIIIVISSMFSTVIYRMLANEVDRLAVNPRIRIQQEFIDEAKLRIRSRLITTNLIIWAISGGLAYFLAGRTLNPIAHMLEDQQRFVSDASHELRTPLTALRSAFEVYLRDKPSLTESTQLIKDSLADVKKLQNLSTSLLQLVRYHQPGDQAYTTRVELADIQAEAVKRVTPIARTKKVVLSSNTSPVATMGDFDSLVNLLVILLDNAIKYSPSKSTIHITTKKERGAGLVIVADQGIGISKTDLPHIFDRFYRSDSARSRTAGGYGLGLSIAKKIAESHNGSLSVTSVISKGSTFTLKLPLAS